MLSNIEQSHKILKVLLQGAKFVFKKTCAGERNHRNDKENMVG